MRRAREITRTHLAKRLGLAPAYIRQVENGSKRPSRATIAKLAEGLGISPIVALAAFRAVSSRP
jgi:transcriptional regulator with XRE-family HTH domain